VSTLLHAIVYVLLHNLLNVLVHIANKMGLQKNMCIVCRGNVVSEPLPSNDMTKRFMKNAVEMGSGMP
jgi:hypothetical protein